MKFLADANIPQSVIKYLDQNGYDVTDLKQINYLAKDVEVIKLAKQDKRIILTLDKDFISRYDSSKMFLKLIHCII